LPQFFLVRHGQASFGEANYDKLSALGHQQSRWLGEYYRECGIAFDALTTGEQVRHAETGQGILDGLGTDLTADRHPGLNEFGFHDIMGAYLKAFPEQAPANGASITEFFGVLKKAMAMWRESMLEGPLPETWAQFKKRVLDVMTHIQQTYCECKQVMVISSGGAVSMWLCHMLRCADETVGELNLQIRNTSISKGFFNDRVFRLSTFNQMPHLECADRCQSVTYS